MSIAAKQTLCPGMLPDIQSTKGDGEGESLSWVGMEQIDLPIDIAGRPVSAKVNAGINLLSSPEAEKGIHMSRLYLLLDELTQGEITPALLQHVLKAFLVSHQGRSDEASIEISGDLLLSRKSLNSNHGNRPASDHGDETAPTGSRTGSDNGLQRSAAENAGRRNAGCDPDLHFGKRYRSQQSGSAAAVS